MSSTGTETAALSHYRTLRDRILNGTIGPDQRLYESALTDDLGTSRTPIREALTMLEQDGILQRERRGFRVRERTMQEVLNYFDVRGALESLAAESAAERATELERAQMTTILRNARTEPDEVARAELHIAWHRALHRASHNEALEDFITRAETMISLHQKPWTTSVAGSPSSQVEHEEVMDAITQRDAPRARELMAAHMSHAKDYQLQVLSAEV